jgi:hypothetical protein
MHHQKNELIASLLIAIVALSSLSTLALATQLKAGVKVGDYAEYNVSFTGSPWAGHDANWARMDVVKVDGLQVGVNFTTRISNGEIEYAAENLDFAAGRYIDYFVVSSGLSKGDLFFDSGINANITVGGQETKNYAGANRTVISGVVSFVMLDGTGTAVTLWYWDQATGVAVEAISIYPTFTMHTTIDSTNLWAPQAAKTETNEFTPTIVYLLAAAVLVLAASLVTVSFRGIRKHKSAQPL